MAASNNKILIAWGAIKPDSRRVLLNKRLFGYVQFGKPYLGLVQKLGGEKLASNCIIIPTEHKQIFLELFKLMCVDVRTKEVMEFETSEYQFA